MNIYDATRPLMAYILSFVFALVMPISYFYFFTSKNTNQFLSNNRSLSSLIPEEGKKKGIHIYGWNADLPYSKYDAYPSNPDLDMEMMILTAQHQSLDKYYDMLRNVSPKPYIIIDQVCISKGGLIKNQPCLSQLAAKHDISWLKDNYIDVITEYGRIYKLKTLSKSKAASSM